MKTQITREFAEQRLGEYIARGREKSASVVRNLANEAAARIDVVVPRQMMDFRITPETISLQVSDERLPNRLGFSDWSEDQMLGTLKVPSKFLHGLMEDGTTGAQIAEQTLNNLRYRIGGEEQKNGKARRLLRVVNDEVRGWLSPTYGMFDQSEILNGFATAIQNISGNVLFTAGVISDRRYGITAIRPQVIEVWQGEYVVIGGQLQSSDYGFGAVDLVQNVMRVVCANGAIGLSFFRKIHRAAGFGGDDNHIFEISERTRQLGAAATVSLLTDGVRGAFSDDAIDRALDAYRVSAAREINPHAEAKTLREHGTLTKEEAETVPTILAMDLEILPDTEKKNSALRFGQLLAHMAGKQEGEKQINLMEAAGRYYLPQ